MELQLSLHNIETGLRDLYGMREEAETVDELALIETAIRNYITAEIKKADSISDFVLMLDRLAGEPKERKIDGVKVKELCEIDQEIERLKERRTRFRKIRDSVLDTCKFVMQGMPWKEGKPRKIEGVRHTISLRGNGGKQAVVVTDESLVPDEFKRVTVTLDLDVANALMFEVATEWEGPLARKFIASINSGKPEVSLSRISDELNKPCDYCGGAPLPVKCEGCGGTYRKSVPGARLEERGESVHIS